MAFSRSGHSPPDWPSPPLRPRMLRACSFFRRRAGSASGRAWSSSSWDRRSAKPVRWPWPSHRGSSLRLRNSGRQPHSCWQGSVRVETTDTEAGSFEPRRAGLLAAGSFLLPVLLLCWPIAQGYFLGGTHSDQYVAGYAFRLFGAEEFLATGRIPQWNPYLFGGMPFLAASSGDIFYPPAWLRWVMPVGTAMAVGFAAHLFLAGILAYAFFRALRCSWAGAVVGGLAYELTGILASLAHPGHDGKLFVSALAPLLFLALLRVIRDGRAWHYGTVAVTVGLCI